MSSSTTWRMVLRNAIALCKAEGLMLSMARVYAEAGDGSYCSLSLQKAKLKSCSTPKSIPPRSSPLSPVHTAHPYLHSFQPNALQPPPPALVSPLLRSKNGSHDEVLRYGQVMRFLIDQDLAVSFFQGRFESPEDLAASRIGPFVKRGVEVIGCGT